MRKALSAVLVLLLVLSLPLSALANTDMDSSIDYISEDGYTVRHISPEKIAYIPNGSIINPKSSAMTWAANSFDFSGFNQYVLVPSNDRYVIDANVTTVLTIRSCAWLPTTSNVEIGLYNIGTGTCYGRTYYNGTASGSQIYSNLPSGTYWVYAMNLSPGRLSSGVIQFSLS